MSDTLLGINPPQKAFDMTPTPKKKNRNKINLWIDIAIFITFIIGMVPRFGSIAVHEWLTLALIVVLIVHLLLHWDWIITVTKRLFGQLPSKQRINYILNVLLFIDMIMIMLSGIMISEVALPLWGILIPRNFFWRGAHSLSSNLGVVILGIHVGLHWQWIVNTFHTYVIRPITRAFNKPATSKV